MERKAFIIELLKLADTLDGKGLQREANELDSIIKEAQTEKKYPGMPLPEWRKLQLEKQKSPELAPETTEEKA